jgi:hypothetical protein
MSSCTRTCLGLLLRTRVTIDIAVRNMYHRIHAEVTQRAAFITRLEGMTLLDPVCWRAYLTRNPRKQMHTLQTGYMQSAAGVERAAMASESRGSLLSVHA